METGWPQMGLLVMQVKTSGTFSGPTAVMSCSSFSMSMLPLNGFFSYLPPSGT